MVYLDMDILDSKLNEVDVNEVKQNQKKIDFMLNVLACDPETLEKCSDEELLVLFSEVGDLLSILDNAEIPNVCFSMIHSFIEDEGGIF